MVEHSKTQPPGILCGSENILSPSIIDNLKVLNKKKGRTRLQINKNYSGNAECC